MPQTPLFREQKTTKGKSVFKTFGRLAPTYKPSTQMKPTVRQIKIKGAFRGMQTYSTGYKEQVGQYNGVFGGFELNV